MERRGPARPLRARVHRGRVDPSRAGGSSDVVGRVHGSVGGAGVGVATPPSRDRRGLYRLDDRARARRLAGGATRGCCRFVVVDCMVGDRSRGRRRVVGRPRASRLAGAGASRGITARSGVRVLDGGRGRGRRVERRAGLRADRRGAHGRGSLRRVAARGSSRALDIACGRKRRLVRRRGARGRCNVRTEHVRAGAGARRCGLRVGGGAGNRGDRAAAHRQPRGMWARS